MDRILTKKNLGVSSLLIVAGGLMFVGLMLSAGAKQTQSSLKKITIGSRATVNVELAETDADRIRGLSKRKSLPIDNGMLFIFNDYASRVFWMKDLEFPLDIIWIYDGQVVGIEKSLPPAGSNPTVSYISPGPVNMVLEVNGGWADNNDIKIGDVAVVK